VASEKGVHAKAWSKACPTVLNTLCRCCSVYAAKVVLYTTLPLRPHLTHKGVSGRVRHLAVRPRKTEQAHCLSMHESIECGQVAVPRKAPA